MPLVTLRTNLPESSLPKDFLVKFSAKLAEVLEKPEKKICASVICGDRIIRGGSTDPLGDVYLVSIGTNKRADTQNITQKLTPFISQHSGIPVDRICIFFQCPEPHMVGFAGNLCG